MSDEHARRTSHGEETESGQLSIHDDEQGIHIDVRIEDVPKGAVARRLQPVLRLAEYHNFQSEGRR